LLNNIPHGKKDFNPKKMDFDGSRDKEWDIKVAEKDGKYGFVDSSDEPVGEGFAYDYAWIPEVSENHCNEASFAFVRKDDKSGFADRNAKLMGEGIVYDGLDYSVIYFVHGESLFHVPLKKNGKWGFIDKNFRVVGEGFIYDEVEGFNREGDLAKVKKDDKWWLMDSSGIVIEEIKSPKKISECEQKFNECKIMESMKYVNSLLQN
jgi:hypothetical protein